jgi:DNA-binding CsgD family transcriptional regulator
MGGAGQILMASLWRQRLLILEWRQVAAVTMGSYIFAAITLLVATLLPFVPFWIMMALLPAASIAAYYWVNRWYPNIQTAQQNNHSSNEQTTQTETGLTWNRRNSFITVYTFMIAFIACYLTSPEFGVRGALAIGTAVFFAALLQVYVVVKAKIDFSRLLPILFLPGVGISLFGISFAENNLLTLVCVAIAFFLFACYEMLNASSMYMSGESIAGSSINVFFLDQIGGSLGLLAGWIFGLTVFSFFDLPHSAIIAICFMLVIGYSFINIFLFNKIHYLSGYLDDAPDNLYRCAQIPSDFYLDIPVGNNDTGVAGKGRFRVRCEQVAKHYTLSPRQSDVFFLLARGHNVQHIQKELYISTHTVKSHIYSIYSKLGIHTHQELLDLVANYKP